VNKSIGELSTVALAQHGAEVRFRALTALGSPPRGLKLLEKIDLAFARRSG